MYNAQESVIDKLRALICYLLECYRRQQGPCLRFTFDNGMFAAGKHLEIGMNLEQFVLVTVVPTTAHGHPTPIDGDVVFTVDHPELVTIEQQDATSAKLVGVQDAAIDPAGVSVLVSASFDADLGTGVDIHTASGALLVTAAGATTATITFGDPQDQ